MPDPAAAPQATRPTTPAERLEWRPQEARRPQRVPTIADPVIEPAWAGIHVLAHFDAAAGDAFGPWLMLLDEGGEDATGSEPAATKALAEAVLAGDAVIDGWLTEQASHTGEGASIATTYKPNPFSFITGRPGHLEVPALPHQAEVHTVAFVAVDLLRVDGVDLLEVPLLERKRILESVLRAGELVRVTPFTRPPLSPWLVSWQASGFHGALIKGANGHYEPGTVAPDWAYVAAIEGKR
ncbi:MAG: ATP-dependent DNA ligase [Candidatus Limnocylindrales bacterium]